MTREGQTEEGRVERTKKKKDVEGERVNKSVRQREKVKERTEVGFVCARKGEKKEGKSKFGHVEKEQREMKKNRRKTIVKRNMKERIRKRKRN